MARFAAPKNSFLAGELSPKAYGRSELPEYQNGTKSLLNTFVPIQGGAETRTGSQFMGRPTIIGGNSGEGRLIDFIVSNTEAYVVLLSQTVGGQGIKVFNTNGTPATVTPFIASRPYTPPAIGISVNEVYEFQVAQSGDIMWFVHPNHRPFQLRRIGSSNFQLCYFDDPTIALAGQVNYKQVLFYPFLDMNQTGITLQITTAPASPETYDRAVDVVSNGAFFDPLHVGAYFKLNPSGLNPSIHTGTMCIQITGYVSPTHVTAVLGAGIALIGSGIGDDINGGTGNFYATPYWWESAWSDYRGWPRAITFFENRLIMGGTRHQPDTLWASKVNNFNHFMAEMLIQDWNAVLQLAGSGVTNPQSGLDFFGSNASGQVVKETDPYGFTLSSQEVNAIQWLSRGQFTLSIGTLGSEYIANAGQDRILSALNPSFVPQTNYGSAYLKALKVGPATLMVCRDGKTVRDFSYDPRFGMYKAPEISLFGEHLLKGSAGNQIVDMAFQASRNLVWFLLETPNETQSLVACTFDKDRAIVAFHHHVLGGYMSYLGIDGVNRQVAPHVTGLCVVPNADTGHDDLWLNVTRIINGAPTYFLERIGSPFVEPDFNRLWSVPGYAPIFADCSKTVVAGGPQTVFSGFLHLQHELVSVLADGKAHPAVFVDNSGAVTLQYPATQVIVGLPFKQRIELLPVAAGAVLGSAMGAIQRIDQATIRFYGSCGAKIGRSDDKLETINFLPAGQSMSSEILPFTGIKRLAFGGTYDEETSVIIEQDLPLPMNISSITLRGTTNET